MLLAGCFGVAYLAVVFVRMHRAEAAADVAVAGQRPSAQPSEREPPAHDPPSGDDPLTGTSVYGVASSRSATGAVLGRMEIPKLNLSVPLIDGVRDVDLQRGAGHIPGTAMAGGLGTVGIAAHRDTFFRPLRQIAPGVEILVAGRGGTFAYEVTSTEIVAPDKVSVLDVGDSPQLALITCYPFNYIGAAPKRFIVHARLLSLEPSAQP